MTQGTSIPVVRCSDHKIRRAGRPGQVDQRTAKLLPYIAPRANCEDPAWFTCDACGQWSVFPCDSSNECRCQPCAKRYRRRVGRLAMSGRVVAGSVHMFTFTAPGENRHRLPSGAWCPCTPAGGIDVGKFNANLGHAWNRLCQDLRRYFGEHLEYFRAVEVQDRGALHLHVLIRFNRSRKLPISTIRKLAIKHGFGHALDISKPLDEKGCWYVAKYVSKAASQRDLVPWTPSTRPTTSIGHRPNAPYRCWTASRAWGQTMRGVRLEQRAWWEAQRAGTEPAPAGEYPPLDSDTDRYTSPQSGVLERENETSVR